MHTRDEAIGVVTDWLRHGFPTQGNVRTIGDTLSFDSVVAGLRRLELHPDQTAQIIGILKERGFLESAVVRSGSGSARLIDYLSSFWNYSTSPYIREKHLHGQRIGHRQAVESTRHVKYWLKYFGIEKRIGEVSKNDLRDFSLWLAEHKVTAWTKKPQRAKKGVKKKNDDTLPTETKEVIAPTRTFSPGYINKVLLSELVALKWAASHEEIPIDPGRGLMKFAGNPRVRGILSEDEAQKLFVVSWKHERARVGSLVAMTTGLRAGEVLALRVEDIGTDRLYIRHSWSWADGLKSTKTGIVRIVPLLPSVRTALFKLIEANPHGKDGFVFYGLLTNKPMDYHFLLDGLKEALISIGISEEERIKRNIVFHSWRHYFATRMADKLDARMVQRATGHMTASMLEHYAAHELEGSLGTLNETADEVFGKVLRFAISA
jgi:integrase